MTKKVAHCVFAYRRDVDIDVAMSVARDAAWCGLNKWTHMPFYVDSTGIARARNQAVREAREQGADLLLMQDRDTFALPPYTWSLLEALYRTMAKFVAPVVGAGVPMRNRDSRMNCEPYNANSTYPGEVGTGLMLINLNQLSQLEGPWFKQLDSADGESVVCGEDIYFCRKVRELGHAVIVDTTFPTCHAYTAMHASVVPTP